MKPTIPPGTRVADRFTILRFLAEGGMGEVYEARDETLEEVVALKFLSRRNLGDDHLVRRFRREIQLARKVTHPNVCRLYDVFEHDLKLPGMHQSVAVTFVSMEMLHGETLEDRLERCGRLTEGEALPMIVQMCRALAAAHDVGIVHRDFKSNNVMLHVSEDGAPRVVVTDFGLARSMSQTDPSKTPLTVDQLILGTADYMSPEQIQGAPVSPRSDLYALGVVIFEMVTGAKPYSAPNPMQLLVQRVSESPARPSDFVPELSPTWENAILRCLEENPEDRPASARDVLRALGFDEVVDSAAWAPAGPTSRTPTPLPAPPEPSRRGRRRRRHGLMVAVAILALALVTLWARGPGDETSEPSGVFAPQRLTTGLGLELDPRPSP
ncbi:MAG: serine/threonine-protein kinase, partial [Acidobacteriota bacterium]